VSSVTVLHATSYDLKITLALWSSSDDSCPSISHVGTPVPTTESGNFTMRGSRMALTTTGVDAWRIVESDDSAPKVSDPSYDREVLMRSAKVYKHATLPLLDCLLIADSNHRSRNWHIHKEDGQHVFNPGC